MAKLEQEIYRSAKCSQTERGTRAGAPRGVLERWQVTTPVDIGGIVYDEKGKPADSFVGRLKISPNETPTSTSVKDAIYSFQSWLGPGLYQVRVGVRDIKSGRLGSAMQWIEIPKDSTH